MLRAVTTMMLPSDAGFGAWSVAAAVVLGTLLLCKLVFSPHGSARKNLPPGPCALPVVGNLHLLGKRPHEGLAKLAQTYGPVMSFWMGQKRGVIISSPAAAEEVLKTQDQNFFSRPNLSTAEFVLPAAEIILGPQTPTSIHLRKILHMQMSSPKQLKAFQSVRLEEIDHLLRVIPGDGTTVVPVRAYINLAVTNTFSRMILGKPITAATGESEDEGLELEAVGKFKALVEEAVQCMLKERVGDFIPVLKWMNTFNGALRKRLQNLKIRMDSFMSKVMAEHLMNRMSRSSFEKDLADVLLDQMEDKSLKVNITQRHVELTLWVGLLAGPNSTSEVIEWVMAECIRNPHVMTKVQAELDAVVGRSRRVEETDIPNLKYLQAVIKETYRLHLTLLMPPRQNATACKVLGNDIPAGTMLMVNSWAIARDPSVWEDPLEFKPERFLEGMPNAHIDVQGNHFELLAFGTGRRLCPGLTLATAIVHIQTATLLQCFDWSLPGGLQPEDLDMSTREGPVPSRAQPLSAVAKARLSIPLIN